MSGPAQPGGDVEAGIARSSVIAEVEDEEPEICTWLYGIRVELGET